MTTAATSRWAVQGTKILVNGQPFFANGICYSPIPWGACPSFVPFGDFNIKTWESIWRRDLGLMQTNGVNVLKTYNTLDAAQLEKAGHSPDWDHDHRRFLDACWNGGSGPVYVLLGYAPPSNDLSIFMSASWNNRNNADARAKIKKHLVSLAQAYGAFPAVMGFVMANEINADVTINNPAFFQYWNDVANAIVAVAPGKLTALANVDDGMKTVQNGNAHMTAANFFWGINSYRGNWTHANGFDVLFATFATATNSNPKPLMVTEWGASASTHDSPERTNARNDAGPDEQLDLVCYGTLQPPACPSL